MDKVSFISEISPLLKAMGYKKRGQYWYKKCLDVVRCVNVQGSQWNRMNYYVNIGFFTENTHILAPTILNWYCRHRCTGKEGEVNISIDDFMLEVGSMLENVSTFSQLHTFLQQKKAVKVVNQYWF